MTCAFGLPSFKNFMFVVGYRCSIQITQVTACCCHLLFPFLFHRSSDLPVYLFVSHLSRCFLRGCFSVSGWNALCWLANISSEAILQLWSIRWSWAVSTMEYEFKACFRHAPLYVILMAVFVCVMSEEAPWPHSYKSHDRRLTKLSSLNWMININPAGSCKVKHAEKERERD